MGDLNSKDFPQKIPKKFIMEHGKSMSSPVSLCVPDGRLWQVELINIDKGEVWFKKGWDEFTHHYSIGYGHFLVFRYQGNSVFHVIIFDASASEIEYPTKLDVNYGNCQKEDGYFTRKHGNKKAKLDSVATTPGEGNINGRFEETRADTRKSVKLEEEMNPCPQDNGNKKVSVDLDTSDEKQTWSNLTAERMEALRLANTFRSNMKSHFRIVMRPSYVHNLTIARGFFQKYLNAKNENCIIQLSNGRTWPVKCAVYQRCAKLNFGWKTFVLDNSLAMGDVCVFEVISKMENLLKVFISRAS